MGPHETLQQRTLSSNVKLPPAGSIPSPSLGIVRSAVTLQGWLQCENRVTHHLCNRHLYVPAVENIGLLIIMLCVLMWEWEKNQKTVGRMITLVCCCNLLLQHTHTIPLPLSVEFFHPFIIFSEFLVLLNSLATIYFEVHINHFNNRQYRSYVASFTSCSLLVHTPWNCLLGFNKTTVPVKKKKSMRFQKMVSSSKEVCSILWG